MSIQDAIYQSGIRPKVNRYGATKRLNLQQHLKLLIDDPQIFTDFQGDYESWEKWTAAALNVLQGYTELWWENGAGINQRVLNAVNADGLRETASYEAV